MTRLRQATLPDWARTGYFQQPSSPICQPKSSLADWEREFNEDPSESESSNMQSKSKTLGHQRSASPPPFDTSYSGTNVEPVAASVPNAASQQEVDEAFFNMLRSDEPAATRKPRGLVKQKARKKGQTSRSRSMANEPTNNQGAPVGSASSFLDGDSAQPSLTSSKVSVLELTDARVTESGSAGLLLSFSASQREPALSLCFPPSSLFTFPKLAVSQTRPRRRITGGALKRDRKEPAAAPPPPPINKAQQECDNAFFNMLRINGGAGDAKPEMQIGLVSPRVSYDGSVASAASAGSSSLSRPTSSSSQKGRRRRGEAVSGRRNAAKSGGDVRSSHEDVAIPR